MLPRPGWMAIFCTQRLPVSTHHPIYPSPSGNWKGLASYLPYRRQLSDDAFRQPWCQFICKLLPIRLQYMNSRFASMQDREFILALYCYNIICHHTKYIWFVFILALEKWWRHSSNSWITSRVHKGRVSMDIIPGWPNQHCVHHHSSSKSKNFCASNPIRTLLTKPIKHLQIEAVT